MQIVLFLILILLVAILLVSKKESMSKNTKISIYLSIAFISLVLYFYENFMTKTNLHNREIVNAFKQGKSLVCKEYDNVNKREFIYVSGTQTFIPKSGIETLEGLIVRVKTCKVKE